MDIDPSLVNELATATADTTKPKQPKPPAGAGRLSQFWQTVKSSFTPKALNQSAQMILDAEKNVPDAVGRGVLNAADATSNTLMGAAAGLSKKTGAYKVGRTSEEQDAFLKWYDQPTSETNPLQFGEDRIRRWLGPSQGGLTGFVETASQFAAGMKLMNAIIPFGGGASKFGKAATMAAKGAATDMTVFDPHMQRLSNLIQNGPEWMRNPVTEFLQSKEGDSDAYGRFKAGLEGLLMGSTIDAITHGVRGMKAWAAGDHEAAAKFFKKASKAAEQSRPGDAVGVTETPDGKFTLTQLLQDPTADVSARNATKDAAMAETLASKKQNGAPLDPEKLKETQPLFDTLKDPNATPEAKQAAQAKLDEIGAQGSKPYPEFHRGDPLPPEVQQRMFPENGNGSTDLSAAKRDARQRFAAGDPVSTNPYQAGTPQHQAWQETYDGLPKEDFGAGNVLKDHASTLTPQGAADIKGTVAEGEYQANKAKAAEGPEFANRSDAESHAASMNYAYSNSQLAKGALGADEVNAWRKAMKGYASNKDPRTVAEVLNDTGINVNYVQSPEEVVNTVKALVDVAPEGSTVARGKVKTWAETAKAADGMFKDMSGDEVVANAARIFGGTDRLDEHVYGMRVWMQMHANEVRKLSRMVDANPNNAVAVDELAKALDTMYEFHAYMTGTSSNIARAMNVHQMPVGEGMDQAAAGAAKETPEEIAAQGETLGANVDQAALEQPAGSNGKEPKKPEISTGSGASLELQGPSQTKSNVVYASPVNRAPAGSPKVTEGLTRTEIRALARSIFLTDGDPAAMLAIIRGPKLRAPTELAKDPEMAKKWFGYVTSYRMEAMLSGPKTQVTNSVNNAIALLQRPLEYYYAGLRTGNSALKQQGADMLGGMFSSLRESWSAAKKSFLSGENVLDPQNTHTGGTLQQWGDASWLSRIYHAPSRFLLSGDEFFKQMNYRANLRSQILRQARDQGITDSGQLAERLYDDMKFAFDPEGGAVNPLALQYARVGTFTNELQWGIGADIQRLVQKHPLARVIMPFVRTPVNIFRYAWERTPILNFANQDFRADWEAGGERRAIAQAKFETGAALYATAGVLAATGQITGAGPSDPELRRQWKEAGNQPYSIKIPGTNTWMSYRRLDPTFAPLGLVADMVNIHSELANNDRDSMAAAILASVMSNMSSKTFMQGVTEFADAMSSGRGDVVSKLLKTEAGSFVPNILRQTNPDGVIRETRGMMDELMSRVPGMSTALEPRRNLFGEKVMLPPGYANRAMNPFTFMQAPENPGVADELIKLGRAFSMPATSKNNGLIDLTDRKLYDNGTGQSPYDFMLEQMSKPANGMPSLRSRMEQLVQSDGYKKASDDQYINVGGEKWNIANRMIQAYQNVAWAQTLKAYPKLQEAMKQAYELQGASLAGGSAAVDSVMQKYGDLFVKPKRRPKD